MKHFLWPRILCSLIICLLIATVSHAYAEDATSGIEDAFNSLEMWVDKASQIVEMLQSTGLVEEVTGMSDSGTSGGMADKGSQVVNSKTSETMTTPSSVMSKVASKMLSRMMTKMMATVMDGSRSDSLSDLLDENVLASASSLATNVMASFVNGDLGGSGGPDFLDEKLLSTVSSLAKTMMSSTKDNSEGSNISSLLDPKLLSTVSSMAKSMMDSTKSGGISGLLDENLFDTASSMARSLMDSMTDASSNSPISSLLDPATVSSIAKTVSTVSNAASTTAKVGGSVMNSLWTAATEYGAEGLCKLEISDYKDYALVAGLTKNFVDPNYKCSATDMPLITMAVFHGKPTLIETLLERGATAHPTALYTAAARGRDDILQRLLSEQQFLNLINSQQKDSGMTPLHHAISNSKYSTAKILLDHGADPRLVSRAGLSPLHLAIDKEFDVLFVQELITKGAHVTLASNRGKDTPLHIAAARGLVNVVKVLISNNADPIAVNVDGDTPRMIAADRGYNDIVKILDLVSSFIKQEL